MSEDVNRRGFLRKSIIASTGAALGLSLEERILLAHTDNGKPDVAPPKGAIKDMPSGKIGNVNISRLILGGHFNNPNGQHFWAKLVNDELPADVAKNRAEVGARCIDHGINYLDITYGGEALAYGAVLKGRRGNIYVAADDGEFCLRHKQH